MFAGACAALIALGAVDGSGLTNGFTPWFAPPLGDINLDCPAGMITPDDTQFGVSEKHSVLSIGLSKYADMIYIICTDECDMTVPDEFRDKVMLLNGYELDTCNNIQEYSHWIKASQSHLHAVTHAISINASTILIMEQDSVADQNMVWANGNWAQFNEALDDKKWNMVRLGYRPMTFETDPTIKQCPETCVCESLGEMLCWLPNAGCDLRASDAYLLHKRGFERYAEDLRGGGIIDNGVLQRLPNQLVVTPQVHYQTRAATDFTSLEHQTDVSALFTERCQLGLTRTEAMAAMGTEEEDSETSGEDDENAATSGQGSRVELYNSLGGVKEVTLKDGQSVVVNSAIEIFGGVEAFLQMRKRLG